MQNREPTDGDGLLLKASGMIRDRALKLTDLSTSKRLLWFVPRLNMRVSEGHLRNFAAPVIYDMIKRKLQHLAPEEITGEHNSQSMKSVDPDIFYGRKYFIYLMFLYLLFLFLVFNCVLFMVFALKV